MQVCSHALNFSGEGEGIISRSGGVEVVVLQDKYKKEEVVIINGVG